MSSETPTGTARLRDGRVLAWDEHGDPHGHAVFFFHGTPSSRLGGRESFRALSDLRVRLIVPDRPGVGRSTFQPGRTLTDWPADVAAIADALELSEFSIVGASGGGPYALACASARDPRLRQTVVVSGIGPLDTPERMAGLNEANRGFFEASSQGVDTAEGVIAELIGGAAAAPEALIAGLTENMSTHDKRVVEAHPEIFVDLLDAIAEGAVLGTRGSAYDMWLLTQPWGFDLTTISTHVDFYAADSDQNVPLRHTVEQAELVPSSSLTVWPRAGHLALFAHLEDVLEPLKG